MKYTIVASLLINLITFSSFAADHTVEMKNSGADGVMVFEPAVVKVAVGDTVHFEPTDPSHNSESIPELIPQGAEGWKGSVDEKISITLDKEGVYVYKCLPHVSLAMVGVIVVGEPSNLGAIKQNSTALTAGFAMNKERLDKYLGELE